MFLTRHYATKVWTNLERQAAQNRAIRENREYILPIRLDNIAILGHLQTLSYLDWYQEQAEAIADLIVIKLGKETQLSSYSDSVTELLPEQSFGASSQSHSKLQIRGLFRGIGRIFHTVFEDPIYSTTSTNT